MDLRQLRYFTAVAETCHFGQASERLQVSQSTISQAIRALEDELGATLLERTTRLVTVTTAGAFLYSEAEQIFRRVDEAAVAVKRLAAGKSGFLRLGMTGIATYAYLPRIARLLREELHGVVLSVRGDMLTPDQCDALRSGALGLGILRPPVVGDGIETLPFVKERLLLAMPEAHPLADKPDLTLIDLRDEAWVAYDGDHSPLNDAASHACLQAGFTPRRAHFGLTTSVLLGLVAAGLGVTLVPEGARALPRQGVRFREVDGVGELEQVLAFRKDARDPVVDAAVSLLQARWAEEPVEA
ncbi:LysR family transcriptional regulator [Microbacterium sp. Root53]|uniref:LysR family transcriptional regulator n=1 Tax=Microbacterium sp. Root53 TaxID=1736553 RepID=UPI000700145E|nr:LysR family transcriptional regulator [Microbacterium sp. Root53]KQZ11730.1 LysR family transcriptional regulator [Microbacterium sp. Root53]